ncbi:hypothetical protein MKZ38_002269 [Zalerion maritima]|uniref:Uncharacterized protein n=1 Tax=Zalerion maritima TaxID=339359 RepID=A0AAD5WT84_9PEZI|nr:hypothetical protein MKZ38_002269 [Zalerion maritima]
MRNPVFWTYLLSLVSPSSQATAYLPDSCDLVGDSDIYGIGLRLSYYLASFSAIIALFTGNKSSMKDCLKGINVISFAVLIILIKNTAEGGDNYPLLEWLVIFPMILFPSCLLIFLISYEHALVCGCFGIIYCVFGLLQPWVYFTKLHQGAKPECDPKYFIFVFIDLYNPHLVRFFKAISIIMCMMSAPALCFSLYGIWLGRKTDEELKEMDSGSKGLLLSGIDIDDVEGLSVAQIVAIVEYWNGKMMGLFGVCTVIVLIVWSEKTLKGNEVDLSSASLSGTSQLVPFLVGLFTFLSTASSCVRNRNRSRGSEAFGLGT